MFGANCFGAKIKIIRRNGQPSADAVRWLVGMSASKLRSNAILASAVILASVLACGGRGSRLHARSMVPEVHGHSWPRRPMRTDQGHPGLRGWMSDGIQRRCQPCSDDKWLIFALQCKHSLREIVAWQRSERAGKSGKLLRDPSHQTSFLIWEQFVLKKGVMSLSKNSLPHFHAHS